MYRDDMSQDMGKWLPDEDWHDLLIVSLEEGMSQEGNPKFVLTIASVVDPGQGFNQHLTNIPGKRWLLRQLLEACGIEPEKDETGKKIYNWDVSDVEGKIVSGKIVHDVTPFIGRDSNEIIIPKAKIIQFKKKEGVEGEIKEEKKEGVPF